MEEGLKTRFNPDGSMERQPQEIDKMKIIIIERKEEVK